MRGNKTNIAEASMIPAKVVAIQPLDTDGDGILDMDDDCPEIAGIASNKGCPPDRDEDGIADDKDRCPRVPGPLANNGCPYDRDRDGVPDKKDKCPNIAWKSPTGCPPDTDGDGVFDPYDKCPKKFGSKTNNGCPMLSKAEKVYLQEISNIEFATGTANLERESVRRLAGLKDIMLKRKEAIVLIHGYTDNSGDDQQNMLLSYNRALACKAFLEDSGIAPKRIIAKGFGETRPLPGVDQSTEAGQRANRRVEFKLKY